MSDQAKVYRDLGFVMPAEWQRHDAIWLAWPYDPDTFPDRVEQVEVTYVQIIKEIHESEHVNLFVTSEETKSKCKVMFKDAGIDLEGPLLYFQLCRCMVPRLRSTL